MIKVTLGELVHADNIGALSKIFKSQELSADFKWNNRKLFKDILEEIKELRKIEESVAEKHTIKKEIDGKEEDVIKKEEYWNEIKVIFEKELEFDHDPLDEEELKKIDLDVSEILAVEFLVE